MIHEFEILGILKDDGFIRSFKIYLKNGINYFYGRTDETGSRDCPMCPLYDEIDVEDGILYIKKETEEVYIDINEIASININNYHKNKEKLNYE